MRLKWGIWLLVLGVFLFLFGFYKGGYLAGWWMIYGLGSIVASGVHTVVWAVLRLRRK
jgi:hypothetical protein